MKSMLLRAARRGGHDLGAPTMLAQQQRGTLRRMAERIGKRLDAADAAAWFELGVTLPGPRVRLDPAMIQRTRFFVMKHGGRIAASREDARRSGGVLIGTHRHVPGERLTVNEWARRTGRGDWERDTWRPSRPVLHLALALRNVAAQWTDPRGFGLFPLLANPQWVRAALESAERNGLYLELAAREQPALAAFADGVRVRLIPA
jgi:hypothetical protein